MKRILSTIVLFASIGSAGYCAAGTDGAAFLNVEINPRANSLGEAYTSVPSAGALEASRNPAGLANLEKSEVAFGYYQRPLDLRFNTLAYAQRVRPWDMVFGVNMFYADYGSQDETQVDVGNDQGIKTGSFRASDRLACLSASKLFREQIAVGANLKVFQQSIQSVNGLGYAFDLGGLYAVKNRPWNIGMALRNIGPEYSFGGTQVQLPMGYSVGSSYSFFSKALLLSADLEKIKNDTWRLKGGVEYNLRQKFFVRVGHTGHSDEGMQMFVFGGGVNLYGYVLDYSFDPFDVLGQSHRIALRYHFGK